MASDRITISDDEDEDRSYKRRKTSTIPFRPGETISFSSDEDDKILNRKKAAVPKKAKGEAKVKREEKKRNDPANRTAMVGRKPKPKSTARKLRKYDTYIFDDEYELPDETLPQYLRDRFKEHRDMRERTDGKGQQLPTFITDPEDLDALLQPGETIETLAEKPVFPGVDPPHEYRDHEIGDGGGLIPAPLFQFLKPYQINGTDFLFKKFLNQEGAILGDDMGLGKTIQVIAFLTAMFGKTSDKRDDRRMRLIRNKSDKIWYPRVLIVCPGTLMANWKSELRHWGWWHVGVYHGTTKRNALASAESGFLEIMITTYDSYRNDQDGINGVRWDCVIADECHKIKERKAEITKAMNNINALCRIGLTGTAMQNNYEELWTLLNWANPGRLGSIAGWKSSICIPLKVGQSHDATMSQLAKARRLSAKINNNLLPKVFLRRTKALIAHQLPKKSDRVVFCPLTETQADAYDNFCDTELVQAMRDASLPCYCESEKKQGWCCVQQVEEFGPWTNHVFPVLHTLHKLSNHLGLLVPSGEADPEKHDRQLRLLQLVVPDIWKDLYKNRDSMIMFSKAEYCGKWKILRKLLSVWFKEGDKVLIFSHSVRLLTMIKTLLAAKTDYRVSYLDGSMSYDDRQDAVDNFNSNPDEFVFLISTKAGGVGLNITSANKVVVVDPHWNPSYDLQAQDRAYRIGQVRDVDVFRLISVGTMEEIVYARQIYKQQQANIVYNASAERRYFKGVQGQHDQKGEIFGLTNLFAPLKKNVVLKDIVNKTNIAESRAGVEIVGLDLEASQEGDESWDQLDKGEDAPMSMLAAEILYTPSTRRDAAKAAMKKDPIQAILASAGVEYTHENAEVIGTSKWETKISSRAKKAGEDVDHSNERAFAKADSQVDEYVYGKKEPTTVKNEMGDDDDAVDMNDGLGKIRYKFKPPEDVRKRQFCTMAKELGYDDVTEFALVVEGWTQEQRRDFLEKFYLKRREKLAEQV